MADLHQNAGAGASAAAAIAQPDNQLLVTWANCQTQWVREIVKVAFQHRRDLTDEEIDSVFEALLAEAMLSHGASTLKTTPIPAVALQVSPEAELQLQLLSELAHVNALAPGQKLEFHCKLTIVYGENGAGKSGIVRVLKLVAGTRTAEEILDDIEAAAVSKPNAKIVFTSGGNTASVNWTGEKALAPLSGIQVFDTAGAVLHLDQDLTYIYTPGDLALYPLVQHAIEKVRQRLESAVAYRKSSMPNIAVIQAQLHPGTAAAQAASKLDAKTNIADLTTLVTLHPAEEQERQTLPKEIEGLLAGSVAAEIKIVEMAKVALEAALGAVHFLQIMEVGAYNGAVESLGTAIEQRDNAATTSLAGAAIPGVMKPAWQQLVRAAEQYIQSELDGRSYPQDGDACLYCQQPLAAAGLELVRTYRSYCNDQHQAIVRGAEEAVAQFRDQLVAFDYKKLRTAAEHATAQSGFDESVLAVLKKGEAFAEAARLRQRFVWEGNEDEAKASASAIQKEVARLDSLLLELRKKDSEREAGVRKRRARLAELDDRLTLAKSMQHVNDFVASAKWCGAAERYLKEFATVLRSLTLNAKTATDKLLNADFEKRFQEECTALGAKKVKLAFPARSGQVTRKKVLSEKYALKAILSEGEQKVIALADFLAEVGQKPSGPVVFDDPVNSLDYGRMQQVAARIVRLSQERQVVLFSHNVWFVAAILAHLEALKSDYAYYDIQNCGRPGVLTRGTHPRLDTVKNLSGKINGVIQDAAKLGGQEQLDKVEQGYALIRNVCELIVEQELFSSATERFRPNVRMTTLPKIKFDRLEAAVQSIVPVFERACGYITAHSQPVETLNTRPNLQDLKKDWATIEQARKTYNAS